MCDPTTSWCSIGTAGRVDVRFTIAEGPQIGHRRHRRAPGNDKTSERLVREQLELQPISSRSIWAASPDRARTSTTRALSPIVDITREELAPAEQRPAASAAERVGARGAADSAALRRSRTTPSAAFGGILDLSNHNSLGKARVIGCARATTARCARRACYIANRRCATGRFRRQETSTTASSATAPSTRARDAFRRRAPRRVDSAGAASSANSYVWSYGLPLRARPRRRPGAGRSC